MAARNIVPIKSQDRHQQSVRKRDRFRITDGGFNRIQQCGIFRILAIDRSQKVTIPFGATHQHHDKQKRYDKKSFHASKIRLFPNPENHLLRLA
jgi:hypothetical protein